MKLLKKSISFILLSILILGGCAKDAGETGGKKESPETGKYEGAEGYEEAEGYDRSEPEDLTGELNEPDHPEGKEDILRHGTDYSFDPDTAWIWDSSNDQNSWVCLRKTITLTEEEAASATGYFSVDSKYFLYINGESVIREGGVKRGMSPDSTYFDKVDLSGAFTEGENTIAVLAWHFGHSAAYSYDTSGEAAFLMELKCGDKTIKTDGTWKVKRNEAFSSETESNSRLPEFDVVYHAALDEPWTGRDYDDTAWENATVKGMAGGDPWGMLVERMIPMFRFGERTEFPETEYYKDVYTDEEKTFTFKLPANIQFMPYLSVEADSTERLIRVWTDTWQDNNGNSVQLKYLTKEGAQEFESPAWLSGETIYFQVGQGVCIRSLGYRPTGYDSDFVGGFTSSNAFFNRLWEQSKQTLYVNMRDTFMDCPNRERTQWLADAALEMEMSAVCMDKKALQLYASAIRTTVCSPRNQAFSNILPMNDEEPMILPAQVLMGLSVLYDYYLYSQDKALLEETYTAIRDYLFKWKVRKNGTVKYPFGDSWEWGDSTQWTDYGLILSLWYQMDMQVMEKVAGVVDASQDISEFKRRSDKIMTGLKANYLTEAGLFSSPGAPYFDERVQALAVLNGVFDEEGYEPVEALFSEPYDDPYPGGRSCYPLLEHYVEKACFVMGKPALALDRIRERYYEMVEGEHAGSTLWEYWNYHQGTENHAWSGGPMVLFMRYVAGIRPLSPGYETFIVEPQPGYIDSFEAKVQTDNGDIVVKWQTEGETKYLTVTEPAGTKAEIRVPDDVVVNLSS